MNTATNNQDELVMDTDSAVAFLAEALPGGPFDCTNEPHRQRSKRKVFQLVRSGVLPALRVGRRVYFRRSALRSWIDGGGKPLSGGWRAMPTTATRVV